MAGAGSEQVRRIARAQAREELFDVELYSALAKRSKADDENRRILERLLEHERRHAGFWLHLAGVPASKARPSRLKLASLLFASRLLGLAFTIRWLERGEQRAIARYSKLLEERALPPEHEEKLRAIISDEQGHEHELEQRVADERMLYLGAAVLGLNDALVELTGGLTGLSSSISDPRLIGFSALVVGLAAAMSMAASNFLSVDIGEEATELQPRKAAAYTGTAYVLVVLVLVAPFFLSDNRRLALGSSWAGAVLVIAAFSYYSAVVQHVSFRRRFLLMCALGLGVAVISFGLGTLIGTVLGIDV
jgi:vacuolar iron transporter family protein